MATRCNVVIVALALLASLVMPARAGAISPEIFRIPKEALPIGGTFVQHPANGMLYYFVPVAALARHKENFGKEAGLYLSPPTQPGRFCIVTDRFDFRQLFVHPVTHKLYAHIVWRHVHMGPETLVGQDHGLIAESDDGFKWKDITPDPPNRQDPDRPLGPGLVNVKLAQDPEAPRRVCVVMGETRSFLRALDDGHARWVFASRDWQNKHDPARPALRVK